MVKVLLFLGGLAILLVSSRQMFLMFRRYFCSRQSTDRTQRTPHNLLDEFRWARAFRRCRCRVDLLAIAYLSHQPGTGRSQLIAGGRRGLAAEDSRRPSAASTGRLKRPPPPPARYERAGRSFYSATAVGGAKDDAPDLGGRPAGGPGRPQGPHRPPRPPPLRAERGSRAA